VHEAAPQLDWQQSELRMTWALPPFTAKDRSRADRGLGG
jgi:hypothetical protein